MTLDCDTLFIPDVDQTVLVYSAEPDTSTATSLRFLRVVIGGQDLSGRHGSAKSDAESG